MALQIKPDYKLTNVAIAHMHKANQYVAKSVFPQVKVSLQAGSFYEFTKADLARDNVGQKPEFGHVPPAIFSKSEQTYNCKVDQVLIGIDQIAQTNYDRMRVPGLIDPRRSKTTLATDQLLLHTDIKFAKSYFKTGVWGRDIAGAATVSNSATEVLKWTDGNFDPILFFSTLATAMGETSRRRPNILALDPFAFDALSQNPDLIERIKYTGTTANPAVVTKEAIAAILQLDKIVVFEAAYNDAGIGGSSMKYVAPKGSALLSYAPSTPQIDEPSAGYIFNWDPTGSGNLVSIQVVDGPPASHSEFVEGIIATDMKITGADLGYYLHSLV